MNTNATTGDPMGENMTAHQLLLLPEPALPPAKPRRLQRCSASTAAGRPCQGIVVRDTDPPLCSTHAGRGGGGQRGNQNRTIHGFYGRLYSLEELADLVCFAADHTLTDEIAAARVATRRVLARLESTLNPEQFAILATLVLRGTNTISRLLRAQCALEETTAGDISGPIAWALDELGQELGIEL
jgi:hypothetical protein